VRIDVEEGLENLSETLKQKIDTNKHGGFKTRVAFTALLLAAENFRRPYNNVYKSRDRIYKPSSREIPVVNIKAPGGGNGSPTF